MHYKMTIRIYIKYGRLIKVTVVYIKHTFHRFRRRNSSIIVYTYLSY